MRAVEVDVRELPNHVSFSVFEMPERPNLSVYRSLVVPPGEQSNLSHTYVSLTYRRIVDGKPGHLMVAQCDHPLWTPSPEVEYRTVDEFQANEVVDGYL